MTSTFSFNLLDEPWIPCLRVDGAAVELSLRDTLAQAHTLQMVADGAPQTTAALLRLLLAVAHRVFGPKNRAAWRALWQADALDAAKLDAYFDQWRHRFDLFHAERPFYQVDDSRVNPKSIASLKYGVGFMHDQHFDHTGDDIGFALSPAGAARAVVTLQAFGLGGLSGIPEKHVDAPCAGGVLFFVHGDTLHKTLLLNMPTYPSELYFNTNADADLPAWEQDDPDTRYILTPQGLLDYLTWQSRRPLFLPTLDADGRVVVTQYKLGPGNRLETAGDDPYKVYLSSKQSGYLPLRFSEEKSLWRNSAALFNFDRSDTAPYRAPATFRWLATLVKENQDAEDEGEKGIDRAKTYRCLALGIAKDRGKMLFTRHESLPLLPSYLIDTQLVSQLTSALAYAEQVAQDLLFAARIVGMHLFVGNAEILQWQQVGKNTKDDINNWVTHSGVERAYWAALDVPFQSLLLGLPAAGADALLDWQGRLRDTAQTALEAIQAYGPGRGRSLKAWVHGQRALAGRLRKTLPQLYPPPETTTPHGGAVGPDGNGPLDDRKFVNQDVDDDNANHDPAEEENP